MLEHLISNDIGTAGLVCLVTSVGVILYVIYRLREGGGSSGGGGGKHPPALPSFPLVGSLVYIPWRPEELHTFFSNKAKELGNVFSLQAGSKYAVVLNGRDAVYDALFKHSADFADREPMFSERNVFNTQLSGIITKRYDADFKKYHQLMLSILKEFGFGTPHVMESRITAELEPVLKQLKSLNGQPVNPKPLILLPLLNVTSGILFAHRFDSIDANLEGVVKVLGEFLVQLDPVLDLMPCLRYLPRYRSMICDMDRVKNAIMSTVDTLIKVGLENKTDESFVRSFVEREGQGYDQLQLSYMVRDLFNGGMQTTGIDMLWALIAIANHPDVQRRMQEEIDSVVEKDRLPSISDKIRLPFVEAVTLEVFRRHPLLPFTFPHATTCETKVENYTIPSGTMVLVNMYSVNMDASVWPEPEKFRPDRFLDADGHLINKDRIYPFSLGKRSCPGEEMGRAQVFLFLTALVQHFTILPPDGETKINDNAMKARFHVPAPFEVRFVARE